MDKNITSLLTDAQQANQNKPTPCTSSFTVQCKIQQQQQQQPPPFLHYDDDDADDNELKPSSSELGDCRLPFLAPDSANSKVKSTFGSQLRALPRLSAALMSRC